MTILISSYFPNVISNIATKGKQDYCKYHNYICEIEEVSETYRHIWELKKSHGFYRLHYLRRLCDKYDGWLMWSDFDALITNPTTPLTNFIDDDYDFIIGEDWNGINSGVFFVKSNDIIKDMLDKALSFKPPKDTTYPEWWLRSEQCALYYLKDTVKTKIVHHSLFNGYLEGPCHTNNWQHAGLKPINADWKVKLFEVGDFMLHLVSGDIEHKLKYLKQYYDCTNKYTCI